MSNEPREIEVFQMQSRLDSDGNYTGRFMSKPASDWRPNAVAADAPGDPADHPSAQPYEPEDETEAVQVPVAPAETAQDAAQDAAPGPSEPETAPEQPTFSTAADADALADLI